MSTMRIISVNVEGFAYPEFSMENLKLLAKNPSKISESESLGVKTATNKLSLLAYKIKVIEPDIVLIQGASRGFIQELADITRMKCHTVDNRSRCFGLLKFAVGILAHEMSSMTKVQLPTGRAIAVATTEFGRVASIEADFSSFTYRPAYRDFDALMQMSLTIVGGSFNHTRFSDDGYKVVLPGLTFDNQPWDYVVIPPDWKVIQSRLFDSCSRRLGVYAEIEPGKINVLRDLGDWRGMRPI